MIKNVESYKDPVRNISEMTVLDFFERFKRHTLLIGRQRTITSAMMFGAAYA